MRKVTTLVIVLSTALHCISCGEAGDIQLGQESPFDFFFIDTVRLEMSTIHIDSVITQGTPTLLIGAHENPFLGRFEASTYFRFEAGIGLNPATEDTFDSLGLIIYPYRYSYDQGNDQLIEVYRIKEEYEPRDNFFFQFDSLDVFEEPIGSTRLNNEKDAEDSVFIRLSPELGQEIFQLTQEENDLFDGDFDFEEFLDGLAIVSRGGSTDLVNSIPFDSSGMKLNLYYSSPRENGIASLEYLFPLGAGFNQFNRIKVAPGNSLINNIIEQKELPAEATNQMTFVQGSSGLCTKIRIPDIADLREAFYPFSINGATMEISIVEGSYDIDTPLPDQLSIFYLSKFQNIDQVISTLPDERMILGNLIQDNELSGEAIYEFNLGVLFEDLILNEGIDDQSFYVTLPIEQASADIKTLAIDASRFKTKVKIFLANYNDRDE